MLHGEGSDSKPGSPLESAGSELAFWMSFSLVKALLAGGGALGQYILSVHLHLYSTKCSCAGVCFEQQRGARPWEVLCAVAKGTMPSSNASISPNTA